MDMTTNVRWMSRKEIFDEYGEMMDVPLFDIVECIKPEDSKDTLEHIKLVDAMCTIKDRYGTWKNTHIVPVNKGVEYDIDIVECEWLRNLIQI